MPPLRRSPLPVRDPTRGLRAVVAAVAAAALAAGGCRPAPVGGFLIPPAGAQGALAADAWQGRGVRFAAPARSTTVEIDGQRRPVLVTTPAGWSWQGRLPQGARLAVGVGVSPAFRETARDCTAQVGLRRDEREVEVLERVEMGSEGGGGWTDFAVDLSGHAGEGVTLELAASCPGLGAEAGAEPGIAWGPVALYGRAAVRRGDRPNVLLIVVDTLRADHLGAYGYGPDTSPNLDRLLAGRGTVFEDATSQAPWTLPSVISYLTGRFPGELARARSGEMGVPDGVPTLAERLAAAGYRTGAYVANPTVSAAGGFARGFETFWVPPAVVASLSLHADEVERRARPWLDAHAAEPFFLYLHFLDPHDPYASPDTGGRRSPFYPAYKGKITGDMVHGVALGQVELSDPQRDRAQLRALYDSEIAYVDRKIGELLEAIDPEVLSRTLVVLTADHGEELYDHGGWKHGQTLYQEQIHVPLMVRWDGRVAAGRRVSGAVRLLDLVPTVLDAAGLPAPDELDGVDLLPTLRGMETLPRRAALSEGLSWGPLRAAAVLDDWKLVLFNRQAPFTPHDALQEALWPLDFRRLERIELYDLATDPAERHNLAAERPDRRDQLAALLHAQLDRELPGLEVVLDEVESGRRVAGRLAFEHPPEGWWPYFLAPADRVELEGDEITFELTGEDLQKGFRVLGDVGALRAAEVSIDGARQAPRRIAVGDGDPYRGGAVPPAALLAQEWPLRTSVPLAPALRIWRHAPAPAAAAAAPHAGPGAETRRRLSARGSDR